MKIVFILLLNQIEFHMKVLKLCLKIDTLIQGLLLSAFLINGLAYLFTFDEKAGLFHLNLMFLLGTWQILSGIIFAIRMKGDKRRKNYLAACLLYFALAIIPFGFASLLAEIPVVGENIAMISGMTYLLGVPLLLAVYYFKITFADMAKAHYYRRSFWDLA